MSNPFQRHTNPESSVRFPGMGAAAGGLPSYAPTLLCTFVAGLLLTLSSIRAPFFWDDLHLVRTHTAAELARAWSDTYDADHMENPGLRPLTMYFEHFRALAFGEDVAGHRIFLLLLSGVFFTMIAALARRLSQVSVWQMLLGASLGLLHIRTVSHYFWPTDGVFLATGILLLGAILSFLSAVSSGRRSWLLVSFVLVVLALLTREDSITVYPLLIWFGAALVWLRRQRTPALGVPRVSLAIFGAALLALAGAYWYRRAVAVPDAVPFRVDPAGLLWGLAQTVQNAGDHQILAFPWPKYDAIISLWQAWLVGLAAAVVLVLDRDGRRMVLVWAGAIVIAAAPLLVVARANLLLLPVAFWGLLAAHVIGQLWRRRPSMRWRAFSCAMIIVGLGVPSNGSFMFQQELRTNNLVWMCRNALLLYGVAGPATVPAARRASVQPLLTAYGISDLSDFKERWPSMERKALSEGRIGVNVAGLPFVPRFQFLEQLGLHPRCEPPR